MESVYYMKNKYYQSDDYKTRYAKINRLNIKYNKYNFYIQDFYKIQNINRMYEIIDHTLNRMNNYRNNREINSYVKQWILYNKFYKLSTVLELKKEYKYSFHNKTNIFQEICLNLISLCSIKWHKYRWKNFIYETHYHITKGDIIQWMKKKKRKKLNSALCMI